MKKRGLAVLAALCLTLLLAGCDAQKGFDSLLNRLHSPGSEQSGEQTPPDGSDSLRPEPEDTQQPDTAEDLPPVHPPAEQTPAERESIYPDGVPAPECANVLEEKWDSADELEAEYRMTQAEYDAWQMALAGAGFSEGTPRVNGTWILYIALERSAADYRVEVELERGAQPENWPSAFSAFPAFSGDGTYLLDTGNEYGADALYLTSYQETKEAYAAYLAELKKAGFMDVGYGLYEKEENGFLYEVDTDGAWRSDPTLTIAFFIHTTQTGTVHHPEYPEEHHEEEHHTTAVHTEYHHTEHHVAHHL